MARKLTGYVIPNFDGSEIGTSYRAVAFDGRGQWTAASGPFKTKAEAQKHLRCWRRLWKRN